MKDNYGDFEYSMRYTNVYSRLTFYSLEKIFEWLYCIIYLLACWTSIRNKTLRDFIFALSSVVISDGSSLGQAGYRISNVNIVSLNVGNNIELGFGLK